MVIDLHELPLEPFSFEAGVCIVGAGVAGLSLARRLVDRGHRVILLESGSVDYESDTADLAKGSSIGEPYYDLADSRLRLFGGTTAIWGGRCAELDEIDFEWRGWVPFSGWPFAKSALAPYYEQAWATLGADAADPIEKQFPGTVPEWVRGDFSVGWWWLDSRSDRYGYARQRDLADHPRLTILLHANATELRLLEDLHTVDHVRVSSVRGHRGTVRARNFVLAAGGLENPRLLLVSKAQQLRGIGNEYDLVGRYFMEHPHARAGRIHTAASWGLLRAFGGMHRSARGPCAAMLCPSEALQRSRQILNSSLAPRLRPHPHGRRGMADRVYDAIKSRTPPTRAGRRAWYGYKAVKQWLKRVTHPARPWARLRVGAQGLYLSVRAEQAPNPDSRVLLSQERDRLGIPRLVLDWRLSEIDKHTVRVMARSLDTRMQQAGAGSVEPAGWLGDSDRIWEFDPLISRHPIGGYHHMGTTRMSDSPRSGVVDRDCRVHGTNNLWIAGSSVFPTSGWANPTLTIIALSLRLADRLGVEPSAATVRI